MVKNSILFVVFGHPVFFYTLLYIERGWIRKCTKGAIKTGHLQKRVDSIAQ